MLAAPSRKSESVFEKGRQPACRLFSYTTIDNILGCIPGGKDAVGVVFLPQNILDRVLTAWYNIAIKINSAKWQKGSKINEPNRYSHEMG